jgi:hypothetical protein
MNPILYARFVYLFTAIIITAGVIIILTHSANNLNSLSALIGGYCGIILSMIGIIMINLTAPNFKNASSLFSCVSLLIIVGVLVSIIYAYFDKIASGQVSDYYNTFSLFAGLLILIQSIIIVQSSYNSINNGYFSLTSIERSMLVCVSVITYAVLIIIGISLKFYSTQG